MWPQLVNTLSWWQWSILAAVPPAIILLYFLKLKRRPVEVPSTYLWHRSIEDLHVNAIWQRLRRNLLLFLQLLLLGLVILALLQPGWRGSQLSGNRFIFLIDNSASMQSSDVKPSRLAEAKRRAGELIDQMQSGDAAMIVSFADSARVEQMFTDDRRRLRTSLEAIRSTERTTSLDEALKVASGLANPGRSADDVTDFQVAEALPAKLFILSDGKFPDVAGFSLGNLEPAYVPIDLPEAANVGVVAFDVRRHEIREDQLQAFARLENFGTADVTVDVELHLDGRMIDAAQLELAAGEARGTAFDIGVVERGVLELRLSSGDNLAIDDRAYRAVNPPRCAQVLMVTSGNEPLELALQTKLALELAEVTVEPPKFLASKEYRAQTGAGKYDLVIYDRCRPKEMPQANTLFVGQLPVGGGWSAGKKVDVPQIIDTDSAHPLMQWVNLGDVVVAEATPLEVPPGGSVLIDTDAGPILAIAPRGRFEDAVLGLVFVQEEPGADGTVERWATTNWPIRRSFPIITLNVLAYLGGGQTSQARGPVRPGQPVAIEAAGLPGGLLVQKPSGGRVKLGPSRSGKVNFAQTDELGTYEVLADGKPISRFTVNLLDGAESDIRPRPDGAIKIGYVEVAGQSGWEPVHRGIWRVLLLGGLVVLILEWYIYSHRVHL